MTNFNNLFDKENQKSIEAAHQKIDEVFDTSQSSLYESEAKQDTLVLKEKLSTDVMVGWLPPPGSIGNPAKTPSKAYEIVKNGGKHAAQIPKYSEKTMNEIQKAI